MGGLALGSDFIMGCDGWEYANLSDEEKRNATVYRVSVAAQTTIYVKLPTEVYTDSGASKISVDWGEQRRSSEQFNAAAQAVHVYEFAGVYDIVIFNGKGSLARDSGSYDSPIVYPKDTLLAVMQVSQQITSIPQRAFRASENLEFVNLFPYNHLLATDPRPLDIPHVSDEVTDDEPTMVSIGALAFASCPKLKYLYGKWQRVRTIGANAFSGSSVETPVILANYYLDPMLVYGAEQSADAAMFSDGHPELPLVPWMKLMEEFVSKYSYDSAAARVDDKHAYLRYFLLDRTPYTFIPRFGETGFWDGFSLRACGKVSPEDALYQDYDALVAKFGSDYVWFPEASRVFRPRVLGGEIEKLKIGNGDDDLPDIREPFSVDSLGGYLKELVLNVVSGTFDSASISNLVQLELLDAKNVTALRCTDRLPDVLNSGIEKQEMLFNSVTGAFTFVAKFSLSDDLLDCRIDVATPFVKMVGFLHRNAVGDHVIWNKDSFRDPTVSVARQDKPREINLPGYTSTALMDMSVITEVIGTVANLSNDVPGALTKAGISNPGRYFTFPFGAPTDNTTVFKCSDKDVKYVSNRWQ